MAHSTMQRRISGDAPEEGSPAGREAWRSMGRALWRGYLDVDSFTWLTLFSCLVLQRFALPAGSSLKISVATPIVLGLAGWGLLSGTLVIERRRMALFCGLCAVACFSVATQINLPLAIAPRMSLTSLEYWLAITSFAVLRFRRPMSESAFFGIVTFCFQIVAIAGIAQFVLQFVGVRLFEFTGIVPDRLLIEDQYAVVIPMDLGLNRSNGFFLVEPSVFSQVMALAIVVEAQFFRRPYRLALFFAGLLVSVSGTGWMVLGSYIVVLAIGSGKRGLLGALLMVAGCAIAFAVLSFVSPGTADMMSSRVSEFGMVGTSGNERFVTPFMALNSVWQAAPWTAWTGIGAGASEQLSVPYFYRLNTPVKILMEYGVFGLLFYMGLLIKGTRTHGQTLVLIPALVLLLVTGGYHQFSPVLFLILLICSVGYVRPDVA